MNLTLIYAIVLRILHVVGGIGWVGGAVVHVFFIEPSVKASGPEGGKFMQQLMGRYHFPMYMNICSVTTVLSGALLYLLSSGGLSLAYVQSGPGLGFTVGSVVGILVFIFGWTVMRPRAERLAVVGAAVAAAGGPPTPAQISEMEQLDGELERYGRIDFILLAVSLLAMAVARYLAF
jgi:uncharacterized membrane protein